MSQLGMTSVLKYLRISRKHAHAEFFQQTTPHYFRKGPHSSAKVTEIIDTSANKGEDGLKMMAELASQQVVLLGSKYNQWASGVSDFWISMKPINQANHFIIFQNTPHWNGLNSAFTPHWDEFSLRIYSAKQIFTLRELIGNTEWP